jgi:hypothetical protein
VTALVLDAIVFIVAFPLTLESDEAAWIRLVAGAFALAAAVPGARSVFVFYERHRSARNWTASWPDGLTAADAGV